MARPERVAAKRCAIYTRKSTEDGLEQDFNSLDAQREACAAFITSQRSEGWVALPGSYDDGGFSGGSMERPALLRLLEEIRAGRVDIVVVYKVDRLTRSLADFAKLVETLDAAGASFVSVTQAFNTSTSMGRLTLNMLLSFAQFEREVTAERIRDKIAASKRKGMWMGGLVPLGYEVRDRALVPDEAGAETVRRIFRRYLALGSILDLKAALDRDGIRSKARVSRTGRTSGGGAFSRGALALILRNPVYVGEVRHKGDRHPGQHAAILERGLWDAAQARLDAGAVARRVMAGAAAPSLLAGILLDPAGHPLTPSHAAKGSARLRYRYYVSHALVAGRAADHPEGMRLPAAPLEAAALALLGGLMDERETLEALAPEAADAATLRRIGLALCRGATDLPTMPPAEQRELLLAIGARFEISADDLAVSVDARRLGARLLPRSDATSGDVGRLTDSRPFALVRKGKATKLIIGDVERAPDPDPALVALLAEARHCHQRIRSGEVTSLRALARETGREHRHIARTLPLAFLAPDIVTAIVDGRQPPRLTVTMLKRLDADLLDWDEQRRALGFPTLR